MLIKEKNEALQKAYDDLKQQHEALLFGHQSELTNLKQDLERELAAEKAKSQALNRKLTSVSQERDSLHAQRERLES